LDGVTPILGVDKVQSSGTCRWLILLPGSSGDRLVSWIKAT